MSNQTSEHDRLFRLILGMPEVAKTFFRLYLPEEVQQLIDLETLAPVQDTFIGPLLRSSTPDVLFGVHLRKRPRPSSRDPDFYLLLEHSSTLRRTVAPQVLGYITDIVRAHRQPYVNEVPGVYAQVVYSGNENRSGEIWVADSYDDPEIAALMSKSVTVRFSVLVLKNIPDEIVNGEKCLGLMIKAFRYAKVPGVAWVKDLLPSVLGPFETQTETECLRGVLTYLWITHEERDREALTAEFEKHLSLLRGEEIMASIAESFRREGREQGMQEGVQQGVQKGVRTVLQEVAREGWLSPIQIEELQRRSESLSAADVISCQ